MPLGSVARLAVAVALVAAVRPAAASLRAEALPVKHNLTVRPGEPVARDVAVRNLGDAPVVVRVRLSDWVMDERGEMAFRAPGTTAHSLHGLVSYEPSQFSLGPGESGVVHLVLRLPPDGPATRWGVLLSEVRPAVWPDARLGPRAVAELGTTLYLSRLPAAGTRAELVGMQATAPDDTTLALALRLHNPGGRHLYSSVEAALRDSAGATLAQGNLGTGVVLPGAHRTFTWTCPVRLHPGRYTLTATLNTGEPELIVGETEVRWPLRAPAPEPLVSQP